MCHCEETKGFKTPCFNYCKECNKIINYTQRATYTTAKKRAKKFGLCSSCLKQGERNPFYNKKHKQETIEKIIQTSKNSELRQKYYIKIRTEEYRKYLSEWMKNNPTMKGNSYYKIWVKKYGKKVADQMNKQCSLKKSCKGEKNYWFGKTPPYGSGNGWSGWYKGWYFRSLLELSYMVNVIEKYGISWKTAEDKNYKIIFTHKNKTKNYFPDFILNDKYLIECKPKKLWNTKLVEDKKNAAKIFCKKNNLIYKLRDVQKLSHDEIKKLFESGQLKWIDRYQEKYDNLYQKK